MCFIEIDSFCFSCRLQSFSHRFQLIYTNRKHYSKYTLSLSIVHIDYLLAYFLVQSLAVAS